MSVNIKRKYYNLAVQKFFFYCLNIEHCYENASNRNITLKKCCQSVISNFYFLFLNLLQNVILSLNTSAFNIFKNQT